MKVITTIKNFTKKQAALAVVGVALVGGATGFALTNNSTGQADTPDPIVAQVNDHEGRITNLEGRADVTDQQVAQNTQDIAATKTNTVYVNGGTSSTGSTSTNSPTSTQSTTQQSTTATETPVVQHNPREVTAMSENDLGDGTHACHYTLYNAKENAMQPEVRQPIAMPCYNVGDILPR